MEKNIHQIWIGPFEMPDREKKLVEKIKILNPDYQHILWTNDNLPPINDTLQKKINWFYEIENYAFAADILRIFLVKEYGGLYIDVDWQPYKSFSDLKLENHDGLIIYHREYTSGNELFGCKSNSGFIDYIFDRVMDSIYTAEFTPYWFNFYLKEYFKVKSIEDYNSEDCKIVGEQWLSAMDDQNIKHLQRQEEFENIYMNHLGLHSWDRKNLELMKKGIINY
jgi:hypothetical protein